MSRRIYPGLSANLLRGPKKLVFSFSLWAAWAILGGSGGSARRTEMESIGNVCVCVKNKMEAFKPFLCPI